MIHDCVACRMSAMWLDDDSLGRYLTHFGAEDNNFWVLIVPLPTAYALNCAVLCPYHEYKQKNKKHTSTRVHYHVPHTIL